MEQQKEIVELKANLVVQNLLMEECQRDVVVLRAERDALKAQNSSLNLRVAEFHDDMKEMRRELMATRSDLQSVKVQHSEKFAVAESQIE